jgi:hypothetical protein
MQHSRPPLILSFASRLLVIPVLYERCCLVEVLNENRIFFIPIGGMLQNSRDYANGVCSNSKIHGTTCSYSSSSKLLLFGDMLFLTTIGNYTYCKVGKLKRLHSVSTLKDRRL